MFNHSGCELNQLIHGKDLIKKKKIHLQIAQSLMNFLSLYDYLIAWLQKTQNIVHKFYGLLFMKV